MPFINEILRYNSLSIVGLEKNTGKTECLNYVLKNIPLDNRNIAVSSIGIDGETNDQVTHTAKPEIILRENMFFATSEKHYRSKKIVSEILNISDESTSLGRIVTAKALSQGKILLSGPSSNVSLKRWMDKMKKFNIDLTIVDGAISRMSSASPAISESMILATGAAYSANIDTLVQKTAFVVELINIDQTSEKIKNIFENINKGVWAITDEDQVVDLKIASSLIKKIDSSKLHHCKTLFISGALTDNFLNSIKQNEKFDNVELVVKDFTKIFVSPMMYKTFLSSGKKIKVLQRSKLIAVCVNPTSPNGYVLNSDKLCKTLSEVINLPVYDIVKNKYAV